nr:hypothetical protein CR513_53650 [Ipomoea batatas]
MIFSITSSLGCSPVTVKYLRPTVSLYSVIIVCLSPWKSIIISLSFFLRPFVTAKRVRSTGVPSLQPDNRRLTALERSISSSSALIALAFFRTARMSALIRSRSDFRASGLCRALISSLDSCNRTRISRIEFISVFTFSASSKNADRFWSIFVIPISRSPPASRQIESAIEGVGLDRLGEQRHEEAIGDELIGMKERQ